MKTMRKMRDMSEKQVQPRPTSNKARFKVAQLLDERKHVAFAKRAAVPEIRLSRFLRGCGHLMYDEIWRVASALGVSVECLCDDPVPVELPRLARDFSTKVVGSKRGTSGQGAGYHLDNRNTKKPGRK